jgi:hypothetical protein
MFTLQTSFKPLFLRGGGGTQYVSRSDNEFEGGKLLRFLSQLCPRILPLVLVWMKNSKLQYNWSSKKYATAPVNSAMHI